MELFRQVVLLFLTEQCYEEFFYKFNFLDGVCLKQALSKGLGTGIIIGSVFVKVPQIVKLVNAKSGKGINIYSLLLELLAITANSLYSYANNYPFSAWGEGLFLLLQTAAIATLVLYYTERRTAALTFVVVYSSLLTLLASPITPIAVLWAMQAGNVPIIVFAKLMQAYENYKNGGTGQLSAVTVLLLFAGSLARIFTSVQETGDQLIILTYIVSSIVNGMIASQIIYYWDSAADKKHRVDKQKKKE